MVLGPSILLSYMINVELSLHRSRVYVAMFKTIPHLEVFYETWLMKLCIEKISSLRMAQFHLRELCRTNAIESDVKEVTGEDNCAVATASSTTADSEILDRAAVIIALSGI